MTALLIIIYIAFISLGLPDSMLGSAWPVMHADLNAPISMAGYLAMVVSAGTVVSSLSSNKMVSRFGTGRVTAVSVLMTAAGLLGITFTPNVWLIFLFAIPLGLGGGSVDAALNNFIALHYEARHMSWLHCFWGVGATAGPMLLSFLLSVGSGWRGTYGIVSGIQFALVIGLFATLPLWKKAVSGAAAEEETAYISNRQALRLPCILPALLGFFFFCALECSTGLWAASYLNEARGMDAAAAAVGASMFYAFITFGRLICGFLTRKLSSIALIRLGQTVCLLGALIIALPLPPVVTATGIAIVGLGTSPIYPSMLHETPRRFGAQNSQAVIGLQMAVAYTGAALMPSVFGTIINFTGMAFYPWFLMLCTVVMTLASEYVAARTAR